MLKGNLLIGQSGGPTPVINASLAGVLSQAKKADFINKIYGMKQGISGLLNKEVIDLTNEPQDIIDKMLYTPASILGSCRHKLKTEDEYDKILSIFIENDIKYFVYIGGNDSMDTCYKIAQLAERKNYEMKVIGCPKTIDNDLPFTDHTPGFGSAAKFIALTTVETGRDQESMKTFEDIAIYEIMGRNAGWLTAASALLKKSELDAPHLIYLPEVTFDEDKFIEDVKRIYDKLGYVAISVSEGIVNKDGEIIGTENAEVDDFGHKIISTAIGPGNYLAQLVSKKLGLKARCNRPGIIQRSSAALASEIDVAEAFECGKKTIEYFAKGISGVMVTMDRTEGDEYLIEYGMKELGKVANVEHCVPKHFINKDKNFITDAFIRYCAPLIGKDLKEYARLTGKALLLK